MPQTAIAKWRDEVVLDAYDLARAGLSDAKIAEAIQVTQATFNKWKTHYPVFAAALERGRKPSVSGPKAFQDYLYGRLPKELRKVWKKIMRCEKDPSLTERVEAMLKNTGKVGRQHLFLYALFDSKFNLSEACKKIRISKATLDHWVTLDPEFGELLDEVNWHKGNFFESKFLELVGNGHPGAVMMAQKTFNADRGYGTKKTVKHEHNHSVKHKVSVVPVDEMDLTLEQKLALRDRVRKVKAIEAKATGDTEPVE